jgi:Uma2 family endonuclease
MVCISEKGALSMTIKDQERATVMADWVPGPPQGSWTYDAYAALPDDGNRYEIVQGVLLMSPAPEPAHQGIVEEINSYLRTQILSTKRGLVFTSPIDVVLSEHVSVQPDVLVILKEHLDRVGSKRIAGAPDLVVEVISPGSKFQDRVVKHSVYERFGVPEYWLVKSDDQTIEVFVLDKGNYRSLGIFRGEQPLKSHLIPANTTPVSQFFDWTHGLL